LYLFQIPSDPYKGQVHIPQDIESIIFHVHALQEADCGTDNYLVNAILKGRRQEIVENRSLTWKKFNILSKLNSVEHEFMGKKHLN
jgi:hypothetical protein